MSIRFLFTSAVIALASPVFAQGHGHGHDCPNRIHDSSSYGHDQQVARQPYRHVPQVDHHFAQQRYERQYIDAVHDHAYAPNDSDGYWSEHAPLPIAYRGGAYRRGVQLSATDGRDFQDVQRGQAVGIDPRSASYDCPFHRGRQGESYADGGRRGAASLEPRQPFGPRGQTAPHDHGEDHDHDHGHADDHGHAHDHDQGFSRDSGSSRDEVFFPQAGPPPFIDGSQAPPNTPSPSPSDFQPMPRPTLPTVSNYRSRGFGR